MIYNILPLIKASLESGLQGEINAAEILIGRGNAPANTPAVRIYTGDLEVSQTALDVQNSEPRTQNHQEDREVSDVGPNGPYTLEKQPLEGSVLCKLIYDRGEVGERRELVLEAADGFSLDLSGPSITFNRDISAASHFMLKYSFVGVYTIRDFKQDLLFDIFPGTDAVDTSKFGSLCATIILTNLTELMSAYNNSSINQFNTLTYTSLHTINAITFLDGIYPENASGKIQLHFQVVGQLQAIKSITGGFGIIRKIKSPGKISDLPVDIDIDLE